jgi:hypothetical protein
MVTLELQGHLHTKHVDCKDRLIASFKRKYDELKHSYTSLASVIKAENKNVYEASDKVGYHIIHYDEAHMIAENPIITCVKKHAFPCAWLKSLEGNKKSTVKFYSLEKN